VPGIETAAKLGGATRAPSRCTDIGSPSMTTEPKSEPRLRFVCALCQASPEHDICVCPRLESNKMGDTAGASSSPLFMY
jgi:hypothetical protein